jgi:hypothetical protein
LDDLDADFRTFYRIELNPSEEPPVIEDYPGLDGPRFFKLAFRASAYSGAMAARVAEIEGGSTTQPTSSAPQPAQQNVETVGSSVTELGIAFPGMFEFSKG